MWARVCQRSQLYVCDERKQFGEMNEVCVMACCSAMFIRQQQCVCVCVCVESRVCLLCLNTNSWETVGGMESVPCAAFRGSVVNIVSGTSLTVTHETDADTVADYPTFVWLDRPDRSYFSFLCLCGE